VRAFLLCALAAVTGCIPQPEADDGSVNQANTGNGVRPRLPPMLNHGGPIIAAAEVYTVVWQGEEALGAEVDAFHKAIFADARYMAVLAQYGITGGHAGGVVVIPGAAPERLDGEAELPNLIDNLIAVGTLPKPTPSTIYVFLPPSSTQMHLGDFPGCSTNGSSCGGFGGFHSEGNNGITFEVALRCSSTTALNDDLAVVISHELTEAITDPRVYSSPAWSQDLAQGEIADRCAVASTPITLESGKVVTASKLWSNRDAASGHGDPCQPSSDPYFAITFPLSISLKVDANGNGEATVQLDAYGERGVTTLNYTVYPYGGGCGEQSTTVIEASCSASDSWGASCEGSLDPGKNTSVRIRVRNAATTDTTYAVAVYARKGATTQVWNGEIAIMR
jgi:hypothetical protein